MTELPDTEFRLRLERKVRDGLAQGSEQLLSGFAMTFDEYRYRVGFLKALTQVLDLCAEVEKEMNTPERGS